MLTIRSCRRLIAEAHGKNPRALAVMSEVRIDISGQESTIIDNEMINRAKVVATVCGHTDEQFRATRDEVKTRVRDLLYAMGAVRASLKAPEQPGGGHSA